MRQDHLTRSIKKERLVGPWHRRPVLDARAAARAQTLNDGEAGDNGPDEEAEGGGGLGDLAVVEAVAVDGDAGGDGDGAGEPEDGGDGENGEADNGVVEAGEGALDDAGVEEHDESPDRVEEHKVEARLVAVVVGDDCLRRLAGVRQIVARVRARAQVTYGKQSGRAQ